MDWLIVGVAVAMAIIPHEVAHGLMAYRLGDPTAKERGRLTLNPIAHVSVLGTIVIPAILVLTKAPFLFGWAKPVPVDPRYFRRPIQGMAWVAAAGPAVNFLEAITAAGVRAILLNYLAGSAVRDVAVAFCEVLVVVNIVLAMFNLIPVPPLDGSRLLLPLLPKTWRNAYGQLERYGLLIVALFIYLGAFRAMQRPIGAVIGLLLGGNPWEQN